MDRSALRDRVRQILGETTAADFWTDAELNTLLNEALHRFTAEERWPWLATEATSSIPAGDSELDLVEGVAASRHLNITLTPADGTISYQPKRLSAPEGFKMRSEYGTTTGARPEYYYITSVSDTDEGDFTYVAKFIPTPTGDIDVEYQYSRVPPTLDGDSDIPDLPVEFHMALAHHAAGSAWLKELNSAKAQEQFELYSVIVEQAREEYTAQTEDTLLIAGGEEPTYEFPGDETWSRRLPDTLGP
jgi:hypothetical protein